MAKIIEIGDSFTDVRIAHMRRSFEYFLDELYGYRLKPYQVDFIETAMAMCLDCGFEYGSVMCLGCRFYRPRIQ